MSQSVKLSRHKMSKRHEETSRELQNGNIRCQTQCSGFTNSSKLKNVSTISLRSPALNRIEIQNKIQVDASSLMTNSSNRSVNSVITPVISRAKLFQEFHPGKGSPIFPAMNLSRNTLKSPFLCRMKERLGSTSSHNREGYFANFARSHFEQDLDNFKKAHVRKYLSVDYDNLMPHFSGSQLDTLSTCGQCGQSKVFGSPKLGWCTSEQGDIPDILNSSKFITESSKSDTDTSNGLYVSHLETRCSYGPSRTQPLLSTLFCWKGDRNQQTISDNTTLNLKSISIMFEYKSELNDLCIKLHDISSVMQVGHKPYSVFIKVCLMPGKRQLQTSSTIYRKTPGKDENLHFRLPFHKLSRYELVMKLYKKQSFLSFAKSTAKIRIPLHQYDFSAPAFIVWNLDQQSFSHS